MHCHSELFACHSEGARRLKNLVQSKLREESPLHTDKKEPLFVPVKVDISNKFQDMGSLLLELSE